MSLFDPPKTIDEYINKHTSLIGHYRKTGYDRHIDKESNKLAEKIYDLVKKSGEEIKTYQKIYKEIAQSTEANEAFTILKKENEDIHKRYDFEDALSDRYEDSHPNGVNFIKTFFESLDKLEDYYKAKYNPLTDEMKEETLENISLLKKSFIEGDDIEHDAWSLKDHVSFIFDPLSLEEHFGNKKEELDSVIEAILGYKEWLTKNSRDRLDDYKYVQDELLKQSKLYVESPWIHHAVLTLDLLTSIFITYVLPIYDQKRDFESFVGKLPIYVVIAIVLTYYYPFLGLCGFIVIVSMFWYWMPGWKGLKQLKRINSIRSEIANEGYDGEEICRRLHKLEDEGTNIPSILYPLLKIKHKPSQ